MTTGQNNTNDYAVARELNLLVMGMIMNIYLAANAGLSINEGIEEVNRAYILVVDELQKLYDNNQKLTAIEPEPIWKHFDVLKSFTKDVIKHVSSPNNDYGSAHFARVEKLCILANVETPQFTPEQKKVKDYAKAVLDKYYEKIDEAYDQIRAKKENDWYIPEYKLTYKYGQILINDVLKLKKAHDGSVLDELMLQALNNLNEIFTFTPKKETKRTVSTILSNAGFTPTLRKLFFPEVGKSRGVLIRPVVSNETAKAERIDTTALDLQLKELGATTKPVSPTQQ